MGKKAESTPSLLFKRSTIRWEGLCRAVWRSLRGPYQAPHFSRENRSNKGTTDWLRSFQNYLSSSQSQGPLTPIEIAAVQKDLLTLQRGLTGNRDLVGRSYMQERALLGSYLLFYWFISRAQVEGMLNMAETKKRWEKGTAPGVLLKKAPYEPIHILDLGSGPAPGSIAVADWLRSRGSDTPIHITACDRSSEAVEIGAFLAQEAGHTYKAVPFWQAGESPLPEGQYDILVLGHVLNELWPDREDRLDRRFTFLMGLLPLLKEGGILIMLEPATMTSSREVLTLRDRLLMTGVLEVWAPCFYTASCPALTGSNQTCHSNFRSFLPPTTRILAQRLGLNKDLVKTTAFVFQKRERSESSTSLTPTREGVPHPTSGPTIAPTPDPPSEESLPERGETLSPDMAVSRGEGATQIPNPKETPSSTTTKDPTLLGPFRVVSEPMLNKAGRTRFILCGPSGRIAFSAKEGEGYPAEKQFFSLYRSDSIFILKPIQREQALALGPETRILNMTDSIL